MICTADAVSQAEQRGHLLEVITKELADYSCQVISVVASTCLHQQLLYIAQHFEPFLVETLLNGGHSMT